LLIPHMITMPCQKFLGTYINSRRTRPRMKPIAWYVYAQSMRGPIAEILDEVKAGTTLENIRHGRDTVIEI
jgi:hypothetical protein